MEANRLKSIKLEINVNIIFDREANHWEYF